MLKKRVIPILLIKNNDLVKSIKYKNYKYVGDPLNVVKIFNEKEIDELIVLDVEKSKNNDELNYELIKNFASECYMPLTYGGGIKNLKQAEKLFSLGIEKILINSANFNNYQLIKNISEKFGSQSVIAAIDINKNLFNKFYLFDWVKRKKIQLDINTHIENCIINGAGELLINFVFNEGTLSGFDTQWLDFINCKISIPLIINGGINSMKNIEQCLQHERIDAIGVGAYFIYYGPHKAVLISYTSNKSQ
jgi:cyclase